MLLVLVTACKYKTFLAFTLLWVTFSAQISNACFVTSTSSPPTLRLSWWTCHRDWVWYHKTSAWSQFALQNLSHYHSSLTLAIASNRSEPKILFRCCIAASSVSHSNKASTSGLGLFASSTLLVVFLRSGKVWLSNGIHTLPSVFASTQPGSLNSRDLN